MARKRTAVIDVGGGYRSIFGAGVFDRCMEQGITFDHCYGVSAGSANLASFLSGQLRRCYRFYTVYSSRKEYASVSNFLTKHTFVDLDYVYGKLSAHDGECPLDYQALKANPALFTVVACKATDGSTVYFDKSDLAQDNYDILKASSTVPVANEPYIIDGVPYLDGGIADPVPVRKAMDEGYERIVLVLTRQRDILREQKKDVLPARILARTYPAAGERLMERYRTYNDEVALAKQAEKKGQVLILAPDSLCGLTTLSKSLKGLNAMYDKGYRAAEAIADFLES